MSPVTKPAAERDLAEAIYAAFTSDKVIDAALELWNHALIQCPHWSNRKCFAHLLPILAEHALTDVLARRLSEAARTGPWDAPCDERERCARHIEALAVAIRDHGPTTPEGLLTGIAGAQVGALLDAAASLRLTRDPSPWEGGHHAQEEPGYPGSLLPPKRGTP